MESQSDNFTGGKSANREARQPRASRLPTSSTRKKIEPKSQRSNLPPVRQANLNFVQKHYRLSRVSVSQSEAVAAQRHKDPGDMARLDFELGVNVNSALGPIGENGTVGNYKPERLAEILEPVTNGLIAFQLKMGVVPTIIQEYRTMIQTLGESLQALRAQLSNVSGDTAMAASQQGPTFPSPAGTQAATHIDEQANDMTDLFFGQDLT